MNLYKGSNFFEFLFLFFKRITLIFHPEKLMNDEVQIFSLICIGTACILVSIFLLLQKKMMIVNSISHTILLGIVCFLGITRYVYGSNFVFDPAYSLESLIVPAFFSAFLTHYFTDLLVHRFKVQEDASIGIVFTFLFALGVFLVSLFGRNSHLGLEAIVGNLDAVSYADLKIAFMVMSIIIGFVVLLFPIFTMISFDMAYSKIMGIYVPLFNSLLIFLSSLTLVVGFKSVGVIMILALMTFPVLTARLIFDSISKIIMLSAGLNIFLSLISVAISRSILSSNALPLSTSGILVTLWAALFFGVFSMRKQLYRIKS